jgi:hypothetical protein
MKHIMGNVDYQMGNLAWRWGSEMDMACVNVQ